MNLPKSFEKVLSKYQLKSEDVVFAAIGDLDEEFRFSDTVTVLTKTQLIIAKYPYVEKREFRFGGYDSFAGVENGLAGEPAVLLYDLEQVEKLQVIRQVSTGVLMGVIDGAERYLCQFSNTKMETFMRLAKLLEKQKKGEDIKEEDLDVKRGKEICPKCGMIYPDQERKVCPKCMDKKSILLRVVSYFKPY